MQIRKLRAGAAALVLALLTSTLAAQASPAAWREVVRSEDGTTVSIDSAHVSLTSGAGFIVRTAVRFPQPMQLESGARIDREVDLEELDCDSARIRGIESQLLFDTAMVRRVLLSRAWEPVAEDRRPLFDARCAWLLRSFDVSGPGEEEEVTDLEMPELANRGELVQELARAYPPALRSSGVTGTVHLRMRVLEDGSVDEPTITIVQADQPGFGEAAVQVVRRMRFRPARVERRPVKVWVRIPVVFQPRPSPDAVFPTLRAGRPSPRP